LMSWDTFNRVTGHATISAGISSTINGGSFGDAFKDTLLANIQGQVGKSVAGVIGDKADALGVAGKTIAHGVTSGAIAEITGGKFAAGAAGGAMSEIASNWSLGAFSGNEEYQVALNKVLGGLAAAAVTGDENDFDTGADRAETVHRYNYLSHQQKEIREQDFASCQGELLCIAQHGAKWDAINLLQETSFGAGMLAGVPAGIVDSVQGLVQLGLNPAQTLDALKSLIISGDLLSNVTDTVKQSYLARIEAAEAQYQKAGASGSFNAGVEYGKLLADGASLVAGGVGAVKGGALLTEKVTAKLVKEGVEGVSDAVAAGSKGTGQALREVEVSSGGKGSWTKELNKPEPDTIYKVDGNKTYQTDGLGRVERVESTLSLTKNDRNTYQQCITGKCGIDGDEGGHLIARACKSNCVTAHE
jgi:hypothetical protein